MEVAAILLHVGHAGNALEVVLTFAGLVVTLLALAVAVMSLLRRPAGPVRRRRGHRQEVGTPDP